MTRCRGFSSSYSSLPIQNSPAGTSTISAPSLPVIVDGGCDRHAQGSLDAHDEAHHAPAGIEQGTPGVSDVHRIAGEQDVSAGQRTHLAVRHHPVCRGAMPDGDDGIAHP
jgi:hypothetical protein